MGSSFIRKRKCTLEELEEIRRKEEDPTYPAIGPIYSSPEFQIEHTNLEEVESLIRINMIENATIFHPQEFDDQLGFDCLMKAVNGLMGFAFFTRREQAVRLIQSQNFGINSIKASKEKS